MTISFETKISPTTGEEIEYVFIENADGGITSMEKRYWDEQQAQQTQGGIN